MATIPLSQLGAALQRGTLALFIGADLPHTVTGLPSRADLARGLAREYKLDPSLPLAEVAQRVSRAGSRFEFTDFFMDLLRDPDREALLGEVKRAFRHNTMFFLGYDLSDTDFRFLFSEIAGSRFARTAYALWPGLPEADVRMWRDRGIEILETDPLGILEGLSPSSVAPSREPKPTPPEPEPPSRSPASNSTTRPSPPSASFCSPPFRPRRCSVSARIDPTSAPSSTALACETVWTTWSLS